MLFGNPKPAFSNTMEELQQCRFRILLSEPNSQDRLIAHRLQEQDEEQEEEVSDQTPPSLSPLHPSILSTLLSRLPPPSPPLDNTNSEPPFKHRQPSLAPPKSGIHISTPFPDPPPHHKPLHLSHPPQIPPLLITRFTPTSSFIDHPLSSITLTFSQPMVALSTLSHLETQHSNLPISLTPPVPGKWRWIDTETLQFEAHHRFPFSTTYTLAVLQSCKSSLGGCLFSPFSHTFSTSPPRVLHFFPSDTPKSLSPPFFLLFDQRIFPLAALSHIKLATSTSGEEFAGSDFELLQDNEAEKEWPYYCTKEGNAGKWVAFKLKQKLRNSTSYTLHVPSGCPSAEGPLKSTQDWSFSFSTYGPLVIESVYPDFPQAPGGTTCSITFSNPLDHSTVTKQVVHIFPSAQGLKVSHTSNSQTVTLQQQCPPETTYLITFDTTIKDIYGQSLDSSKNTATLQTCGYRSKSGYLSGTNGMFIMDPASLNNPFFSVIVCNYSALRYQIYQVSADDWSSNEQPFHNTQRYVKGELSVRGIKVCDSIVDLKVERDQPQEHRIFLSPFLQYAEEHVGQLLIIVEPTENARVECYGKSSFEIYELSSSIVSAWIQCTSLSLDIFPDNGNCSLTAWVTDICTGKPVSQASVSASNKQQFTNNDGLASVKLHDDFDRMVVVKKGNDSTFITNVIHYHIHREDYGWHVFNDRGLYRPNEEVNIKGCIRKLEKRGEAHLPVFAYGNLHYSVCDPRNNEMASGNILLNNFGSFFLTFAIPDNACLGDAYLNFNYTAEGKEEYSSQYTHKFKIQEFRRPEYEVKSSYYPTICHYSHSTHDHFVIACASAMYFAGGPLTGAEVKWAIQPKQTRYTPPGQSGFKFGNHHGWNRMKRGFFGCIRNTDCNEKTKVTYPSSNLSGKTHMNGKHEVKIEYCGVEEHPCPITIAAQASIIDLNNQAQETMTTFLVHPSLYYVGFKLDKNHGHKGQEVEGEVIVCDVNGKLVSQEEVILSVKGQGKEERIDSSGLLVFEDVKDDQEIAIRSGDRAAKFSFIPNLAGNYSLSFTVIDPEQRRNMSSYHGLFISGGHQKKQVSDVKFVPKEDVQLIPNKDTYEVGEVAELLLLAPFFPAEGLLIKQCHGTQVEETVRFSMQSESHIISLPLKSDWIPSLQVQIELIGSTARVNNTGLLDDTYSSRPAFAVGNCRLNISSSVHRLLLEITAKRASEVASPGQTIHASVVVKEQVSGKTVKDAEVGLIMVDESVLSLTGYTIEDPLPAFYPVYRSGPRSYHLREKCLLAREENLGDIWGMFTGFGQALGYAAKTENSGRRAAPLIHCFAASSGFDEAAAPAIAVRSNFDPLAVFLPYLMTDEQGEINVAIKLPDNLTRYRIWAVGATERKFGVAESFLTAQLPVMIRPSPPRFLNFSDHPHINVVLQNQTDTSLPVLVAARAINGTIDASHSGYFLNLLSKQRFSLTFPLFDVLPGTVRLQFVVSTKSESEIPLFSDACEIAIPVYTPCSAEAYATYGDVADKDLIIHPIRCPLHVYPQFGGLEISTSSTALQSLTDAVLYLYNYPYECNEQIASRVIGFMSLWDVLGTLSSKDMPSVEEMKVRVHTDMQVLKDRQLSCGGWSWWTQGGNVHDDPFISLHVACALVKVSLKKVMEVDVEMMRQAMCYCSGIKSRLQKHLPSEFWSKETKYAIMSYALYVRTLYNEKVPQDASELLKEATVKHLTMEACGWMLVAFSTNKEDYQGCIKMLLDHIMDNVNETAEHANLITSFEDDGMDVMLRSNRRTDAILLEALLVADMASTLCAKLARGLQAHRTVGRWNSTQENCFALLALDRFIHVYEEERPNFLANIWLGDAFAACHTYIGRSTKVNQVLVPMCNLLEEMKEKDEETTQLIIQREGSGRLYYRVGLVYTPLNLLLPAASYGFSVSRSFDGIDSASHAVRDPIDDVWKMKLGERVKVTLNIVTRAQRYHVALVDFLPAGCEAINSALRGVPSINPEFELIPGFGRPIYGCYKRFGWVEHENFRDERVEAFCSLLWPGVYTYCYQMRVTCKGEFIVPPSKVEEMYNSENFARSATEKIIVY